MRLLRAIPISFRLWTSVWLVALAFFLPASFQYGRSRTIDGLADTVFVTLAFLSMPASYVAGPFVSFVRPITRIVADPENGGDFVVTMVWWFTVGYLQWFLPFCLFRWIDRHWQPRHAGRQTDPLPDTAVEN